MQQKYFYNPFLDFPAVYLVATDTERIASLMKPWGFHLILDLRRCAPLSIRCPLHITRFSDQLVGEIDMVPYGRPTVVRFGEDDKMGFTLVQLIQTSNITAHFCEETNDAYVDVFSCKHFEPATVRRVVGQFFSPKAMRSTFLLRSAPRAQELK